MAIIYLQKRTHRAGAQTCLARLLEHEGIRERNPVLVSSQKGWLTDVCERLGIAHLEIPFPSSRSWKAKLWKNAAWARQVTAELARRNIRPSLVHGNDHLEGLLALELARQWKIPKALMLRSPGMCERDYIKYRCREFDLVSAVGDDFLNRVRSWDASGTVDLIRDGIPASEFMEPIPVEPTFPTKVLVIGSPLAWKGWADLTRALRILERDEAFPTIECTFTGSEPTPDENDLQLEKLKRMKTSFPGRMDDFQAWVRTFSLAINPSRQETFGMAAVETLAAGVPLLSTSTGVMPQIQQDPRLLVNPSDPEDLAAKLKALASSWPEPVQDLEPSRQVIRQEFSIDQPVKALLEAYDRIQQNPTR